jgi:hypothetical protein
VSALRFPTFPFRGLEGHQAQGVSSQFNSSAVAAMLLENGAIYITPLYIPLLLQ